MPKPATEPRRFEELEMLELAARALGKIQVYGRRGTTLLSIDEIEAMACILSLFGFPALPPGYRSADMAGVLREALSRSAELSAAFVEGVQATKETSK